MTEPVLFEAAEVPAPRSPEGEPWTERMMLDLLHKRFGFISQNGASAKPRYVCAEHVRSEAGFDRRTLDFVAVDTWASAKLAIHGVEVKVSRSDWLRELKDPWKSEPFMGWTTHFWLAAASKGIVQPGELPEGWGLLVPQEHSWGRRLIAATSAPRRQVPPPPPATIASLLYAVHRTTARRAGAA
jgi:hypothetical protein